MIIVTGANGQLGRLIVDRLVQRVPAHQVAVSVRDVSKATDLEALGIRVRQGDFSAPDNLRHAFEGAAQVLIVSSNARSRGGDPLAQHQAAIDAAREAGARRIVYTSHMAAHATSAFLPMRDHAATEDMLRHCGIAWTALRHGFYAASGIALMGDAINTGVLEAPADGKVSWTAHADLAEAASIIMAHEGRYDGPTPPLTGAEALDLADLARIASELLDRPVHRHTIGDAELRASMATRGIPQPGIDIALGLYRAGRDGEFSAVDPALEQLLGRRPAAMRDILAAKIHG